MGNTEGYFALENVRNIVLRLFFCVFLPLCNSAGKIKCDMGRGHIYWLCNFVDTHFFTFFSMLDFNRAESQLQSLEQSKVSLLCT